MQIGPYLSSFAGVSVFMRICVNRLIRWSREFGSIPVEVVVDVTMLEVLSLIESSTEAYIVYFVA